MAKKKYELSYGDAIHEWRAAIKKEQNHLNQLDLKKLSKMSTSEILKYVRCPISQHGCIKISPSFGKEIDISQYYGNPELYAYDLFTYIKNMRGSIHIECDNKYYIKFKLWNEKGEREDKLCELSDIHFVFNMILWMPFFILNISITKNELFVPRTFNNKAYIEYVNTKFLEPHKHLVTHNEASAILAKMFDCFIIICEMYGLDFGMSFSLYDLITKWDDDPKIYEINHLEVDKNLQSREAEQLINKNLNRYMEIMGSDPNDNCLKPMIRAGEGARPKQVKELAVNSSQKPDLSGNTINIKPDSNFLIRGIRSPESYIVDSLGNRKASILALGIDESGYIQRAFAKVMNNIYLNPDPNYDCGSINYYERTMYNREDLSSMNGRWYVTNKGKLRQLVKTDYDLIGKTLRFRSPTTCASKNGICSTCYGHLYNQNMHINAGINSALLLSERNYQMSMSAKHVLDTNTTELQFNDEFYDFFDVIEGYRIQLRDDNEFIENYDIVIDVNEVHKNQDIEDLNANEYLYTFSIFDKEFDDMITFTEQKSNKVFITGKLFAEFAKKRHYDDTDEGLIRIDLSTYRADEDLFFVEYKNSELTKPLKDLRALIEKGKEIEGVTTISELITKLIQLMRDGGIHTDSTHVELLARNIVRDKNNMIELPDYTLKNPEYVITSIHNSIFNSDSVITAMTFERLKQQFADPSTFEKTGVSPTDRLFILE